VSNRLLKLSERIRSLQLFPKNPVIVLMNTGAFVTLFETYIHSDLILRKLKNLQLTPRVYSLISALNYLLSLIFCRKQHKKAKA
jgi:hypothetical protein